MTVRLEWKACDNAFIHARLCKFFIGSGYYELQQPIGKTQIPIAKVYNHLHNILRLFDVLPNFPFTTSETMRNY